MIELTKELGQIIDHEICISFLMPGIEQFRCILKKVALGGIYVENKDEHSISFVPFSAVREVIFFD